MLYLLHSHSVKTTGLDNCSSILNSSKIIRLVEKVEIESCFINKNIQVQKNITNFLIWLKLFLRVSLLGIVKKKNEKEIFIAAVFYKFDIRIYDEFYTRNIEKLQFIFMCMSRNIGMELPYMTCKWTYIRVQR